MIHLDTSFLIRALVRGSEQDAALRRWLGSGETLGISAIGWTEFLCGPLEAVQVAAVGRLLPPPIPYGEEDATLAADLFNASGRRRGTLADCMIAAVAIRAGADLATANAADFRRLLDHGLTLAT